MKILRTHKTEIFPNEIQRNIINQSCNLAIYAYNWALNERTQQYEKYKMTNNPDDRPMSFQDLRNYFTNVIKKAEGNEWMNIPYKDSYANAIIYDLKTSFDIFFKQNGNYPRFKSKKKMYKKSYTSISIKKGNIQWIGHKLFIPKFRSNKDYGYLSIAELPRFNGEIKRVTISMDKERYYASCLFELEEVPLDQYKRFKTKVNYVGIDIGSRKTITMSNGISFERDLSKIKKLEKRKTKLQRKLSRMYDKSKHYNEQSKNYYKTKTKLNKVQERLTNKRKDDIHKITNYVIRKCNNIALEDLQVKNMLKNHRLAKTIQDGCYYEIKHQLSYKLDWLNEKLTHYDERKTVDITLVNPKNTSLTCSNCGNVLSKQKLGSKETYICNNCGLVIDRDFNASLNIRRLAFGF